MTASPDTSALRLLGIKTRTFHHPLGRVVVVLGLLLGGVGAIAAQPISTVRVADGLEGPTYVVAPPEDFNRLFILRQSGEILIMTSPPESSIRCRSWS